jgi:hypothetical protein
MKVGCLLLAVGFMLQLFQFNSFLVNVMLMGSEIICFSSCIGFKIVDAVGGLDPLYVVYNYKLCLHETVIRIYF